MMLCKSFKAWCKTTVMKENTINDWKMKNSRELIGFVVSQCKKVTSHKTLLSLYLAYRSSAEVYNGSCRTLVSVKKRVRSSLVGNIQTRYLWEMMWRAYNPGFIDKICVRQRREPIYSFSISNRKYVESLPIYIIWNSDYRYFLQPFK